MEEVQYFVTFCCREGTVSSVPYLKLTRSRNLAATVHLHTIQPAFVSFTYVFKTNLTANANASFVITPGRSVKPLDPQVIFSVQEPVIVFFIIGSRHVSFLNSYCITILFY